MKKFNYLNIGFWSVCLMGSLLFTGCEKEDLRDFSQQNVKNEIQSDVIADEFHGFQKQYITITDKSGKNSVDVMVASKSQSALNDYIEMNNFDIEIFNEVPTMDEDKRQNQENEIVPVMASSDDEENENDIYVEFLSESITTPGLGWKLNTNFNGVENGKVAAYSKKVTYSTSWDGLWVICHYDNDYAWERVKAMFSFKTKSWGVYKGYKYAYVYEGQNFKNCEDGSYRHRVAITRYQISQNYTVYKYSC